MGNMVERICKGREREASDEALLGRVRDGFVGMGFDDLTVLEKRVAKLLIVNDWLTIDEESEDKVLVATYDSI